MCGRQVVPTDPRRSHRLAVPRMRNRNEYAATRMQHATHLAHRGARIGRVLQHMLHRYQPELPVGKGQLAELAALGAEALVTAGLDRVLAEV